MCCRDLFGQLLGGVRQLRVKLETGASEDCPGADLAEVRVVREVHEDVDRVRVPAQELLRQQEFGGLSRSDAANKRRLRATRELRSVCERNVDRGLPRIARIVIGSNDQAFSQKTL